MNRITPRLVWILLSLSFVSALVGLSATAMGYWPSVARPSPSFDAIAAAAYLLSLVLCLRIAGEHKNSPRMAGAWLLFAASCGFSVIRHVVHGLVHARLITSLSDPAASYVPIQLPMAIALVLLFCGLVSMWSAFSRVGLGFHPHRIDMAIFTLVLLMLPPVLLQGQKIPEFAPRGSFILPFLGAAFLPACTGIAVLLHRIALEMRGGDLARALRCLILYPALRMLAMMISVSPRLNSIVPLWVSGMAIFEVAPLILTLAVAYRWQITVKAAAAMERQLSWSVIYPLENVFAD